MEIIDKISSFDELYELFQQHEPPVLNFIADKIARNPEFRSRFLQKFSVDSSKMGTSQFTYGIYVLGFIDDKQSLPYLITGLFNKNKTQNLIAEEAIVLHGATPSEIERIWCQCLETRDWAEGSADDGFHVLRTVARLIAASPECQQRVYKICDDAFEKSNSDNQKTWIVRNRDRLVLLVRLESGSRSLSR